ncbi:hypothetical protein GCM10027056_15760 [Glaciibacter psychrotolerans]
MRRGDWILTGITACALAASLTGCSPSQDFPSTSVPVASVAPPIEPAIVSCNTLLPASAAATALSVEASVLSPRADDVFPAGVDRPEWAVIADMQTAAGRASGMLTCGWVADPDAGPKASGVRVSVLPGAAAEFAAIEPDVDDGLNDFAPADVGEVGFVACRGGEADQCRVEAIAGDTWISLTVSPAPADPTRTLDLARAVARQVQGMAAPTIRPARTECSAALSSEVLANVAGITDPQMYDALTIPAREAGITTAASRHGGLISCSWTSGDPGTSGSVSLMALPMVAISSPNPPLTMPATPVMHAIAGVGDSAGAGCGPDSCVLIAADATMLVRLTSTEVSDTTIAALTQLAIIALPSLSAAR